MKPKPLLFILLTLAILAALYLLADAQNLGGLFRAPTAANTDVPPTKKSNDGGGGDDIGGGNQ